MIYGQMAETLKNVAELCDIPIILGSQVSRDYKMRDDKRPHIEDIRNSGEIEERANQVVVLHRPDERGIADRTERVLAYVEKNTQGATGQCELVHIIGRYLLADAVEPGGIG